MGDILHALPAVAALRKAHPKWYLGWAVEPRWRTLLCGDGGEMPLVDRTHLVKAKEWARAPLRAETLREIAALRQALRAERYDLCIDLQGAVRSALAGRLAGAPRMIGEDQPREWACALAFRRASCNPRSARNRASRGSLRRGRGGTAFSDSSPLAMQPRGGRLGGRSIAWSKRARGSAEPRCGMGSEAMACGALRSGGGGSARARLHGAGQRRPAGAGDRCRGSARQRRCCPGAGVSRLERLIALTRRVCLVIAGDTGPLASGLRTGQAGGGYLWAYRSQAKRSLWGAVPGAAAPGEQARPLPAC